MHNKAKKGELFSVPSHEITNPWSFTQLQDLYRGLYLQLLQTVLKAALLLGLKERIDEKIKKMFGKK